MNYKVSSTTAKLCAGIFIVTVFVMIIILVVPGCKKNQAAKQVNNGNNILAFNLGKGQVGAAVITNHGDSALITVTVHDITDLKGQVPQITTSPGSAFTLPSGTTINYKSNGDIYNYIVIVTSKSGDSKTWYVKFVVAPLSIYLDPQVPGFFKRTTGWIASDGGNTVLLSDNRVLWLFGDSYTNDYDVKTGTTPCLFNERSTAMVQPFNNWQPQNTSTLLAPNALFRSNTTTGYFNWPANGVQIGDTVYVYCLNIMNSSGGLGFASGGNDVFAKMAMPSLTIAGYHSLQDFNGISFGIGIVKNDADGFVYVYGNKQTFIASNVFVARFPISNPNANWTFWGGGTWNTDITKITPITTAPSTSVQIAKVKNKYLMFTSEFSLGCDGGTHIYSSVSSNITGPFSANKIIYKITDTVQGHYPFFYLPTPHPEYINQYDELLLTYSINGYGSCVPGCVNGRFNPNFYRPRGLRVPLSLIDPSL